MEDQNNVILLYSYTIVQLITHILSEVWQPLQQDQEGWPHFQDCTEDACYVLWKQSCLLAVGKRIAFGP